MKLLATALLAFSLPLMGVGVKSSSVTFDAEAIGISYFDINGKGGKLVSKLESDATHIWGVAEVPLKDFSTDLEDRDKEMLHKYLEVSKYPVASLKLDKVSKSSTAFTGQLTIKKDTKPVSGKFLLKGDNLTAWFKIKINDFPSIGNPSFKGQSLHNEVKIDISATLSKL